MRVLRVGYSGDDVATWQTFLVGQGTFKDAVDGQFGPEVEAATKDFQSSYRLTPDGVVGPGTWGMAMSLGLNPLTDTDTSEDGPNWPPKPDFSPLSESEKAGLFGSFTYVPDPIPGSPENIRVTDGWVAQNLVPVHVPQLAKVQYAPPNQTAYFHTKAAQQLQDLFSSWESAGLLDKVLTWGGSYAARFIRGSRTVLSNHSYGTAFDINVPWNMLGTMPALKGKHGSTRELVSIANTHGFYWGGHFDGRPDGMHFEIAGLM